MADLDTHSSLAFMSYAGELRNSSSSGLLYIGITAKLGATHFSFAIEKKQRYHIGVARGRRKNDVDVEAAAAIH